MREEYATRGRQQHPVAQQQHNHSVRPRVFKLVIFQEQHQHLFSNILTCQHTYVYAHPHLHGAAGPARRRSWWPLCKHGLDNCENWEVCYYTFLSLKLLHSVCCGLPSLKIHRHCHSWRVCARTTFSVLLWLLWLSHTLGGYTLQFHFQICIYKLSSFYFPLFISPTLVLKLKDTRILIHWMWFSLPVCVFSSIFRLFRFPVFCVLLLSIL